jgi:hypothetical protein
MDKVVNWFILLLIFVFDPLAVALVIATNRVLELERNPDSQPTQKPIIRLAFFFIRFRAKFSTFLFH